MASLDERTNSKGRTTFRVRWREGGTRTGQWQSATFSRVTQARRFKSAVEAAGHRWPDDATGAASLPGAATLDQLASLYLADRAKRVRSDRTTVDYQRDYGRWIGPFFGARMADEITTEQVQEWVDAMIGGTLSPALKPAAVKSARDRHALLSGILGHGVTKRLLEINTCAATVLPKIQKGAVRGLRPAEWQALRAALRQLDTAACDLADFLLASGWRWSEATALTTFDVEDYGEQLYVTMGQAFRRDAAGRMVVVAEGKGQASVRRIQLDRETAAVVRRRVAAAPAGGLVFTTPVSPQNGLGGNPWRYSNFRARYWDKAVSVANLGRRPTPHWLRHTSVYFLALAGATLPELQARIGHASIQTTIGVYGRMLTDVKPETLATFAAMRDGETSPSGLTTGE